MFRLHSFLPSGRDSVFANARALATLTLLASLRCTNEGASTGPGGGNPASESSSTATSTSSHEGNASTDTLPSTSLPTHEESQGGSTVVGTASEDFEHVLDFIGVGLPTCDAQLKALLPLAAAGVAGPESIVGDWVTPGQRPADFHYRFRADGRYALEVDKVMIPFDRGRWRLSSGILQATPKFEPFSGVNDKKILYLPSIADGRLHMEECGSKTYVRSGAKPADGAPLDGRWIGVDGLRQPQEGRVGGISGWIRISTLTITGKRVERSQTYCGGNLTPAGSEEDVITVPGTVFGTIAQDEAPDFVAEMEQNGGTGTIPIHGRRLSETTLLFGGQLGVEGSQENFFRGCEWEPTVPAGGR